MGGSDLARVVLSDGLQLPAMLLCFGFVAAVIAYARWKRGAPDPGKRGTALVFGGIAGVLWLVFLILLGI